MATMRERVLVTGASGFVGGHCVTELIAHGYQVRAAVRDPARVRHLAGVCEVVRADLEPLDKAERPFQPGNRLANIRIDQHRDHGGGRNGAVTVHGARAAA